MHLALIDLALTSRFPERQTTSFGTNLTDHLEIIIFSHSMVSENKPIKSHVYSQSKVPG